MQSKSNWRNLFLWMALLKFNEFQFLSSFFIYLFFFLWSRQSQSWDGENTAHCQNHINFNGFPVHLTPHQQCDLASLHHEPPGCGGQEKGGSGLAPTPAAQRKPWDILWDIFENTGCLFQDACALIIWKLSIDSVTSQHPPPARLSHS